MTRRQAVDGDLLVLNADSSSLKFALSAPDNLARPLYCGRIEGVGRDPF
jgi:hypothetical protein